MLMTKQLHELSNKELAELLMDTTRQFIDGLRNDAPIEELHILRDYLTAIRNEIRMKDGGMR